MNQKKSVEEVPGVNPNNLSISGSDLLTGEDLQSMGNPQNIITPPPLNEISDVHTLEGMPNAQRRSEIDQKVNKTMFPNNKISTLDDQIRKDVEDAQKQKFEGVPKNPKDILKSLIAKGEYQKDYDLFEVKWTLRALDQGDMLLALDEVRDSMDTQSGRLMTMMFGILIYAIEAINDIPVYEWFEDIKLPDFNNDRMEYYIAVRRALKRYLEAMPPTIIDILYDKYLEVDAERNKAVNELKNS